MSNSILVTGATGNVGGALAQRLAEEGRNVVVGVRNPAKAAERFGASVQVRPLDYDRPETFRGAVLGVERAFLVLPSGDGNAYEHVAPFLDAAISGGAKHVVLMTAIGVDQAPDTMPHRRLELHLLGAGVAYTILRPNWFMQNFTSGFLNAGIRGNAAIHLPAGEARTAFIDARDIAAVAAACLTGTTHFNCEYPLTGPDSLTYGEAASILSEAAGKSIRYHPITDEQALEGMLGLGMPREVAGFMVGLFTSVRNGWVAPVHPTVERITGKPARTLRAFATEFRSRF
jgi:uncharacterized protein YbjT (DUF2867 family)